METMKPSPKAGDVWYTYRGSPLTVEVVEPDGLVVYSFGDGQEVRRMMRREFVRRYSPPGADLREQN